MGRRSFLSTMWAGLVALLFGKVIPPKTKDPTRYGCACSVENLSQDRIRDIVKGLTRMAHKAAQTHLLSDGKDAQIHLHLLPSRQEGLRPWVSSPGETKLYCSLSLYPGREQESDDCSTNRENLKTWENVLPQIIAREAAKSDVPLSLCMTVEGA